MDISNTVDELVRSRASTIAGAVLLGLFVVLPVELMAQSKPKIAVMPIRDKSDQLQDETVKAATSYLRNGIASSPHFLVIAEQRQSQKLGEMIDKKKQESYKECYDKSCQIPLGRKLAADTILRAEINYFGSCVFSMQMVDLAKEATVMGARQDFKCGISGLKKAIDGALEKVSKRYGGDATSRRRQRPGTKVVEFASEPSDAVVRVDGEIACKATPCSTKVVAKSHTISMNKKDYAERKKRVDLSETRSVSWRLTPNFGHLSVRSNPDGLRVIIEGDAVGETPIEDQKLPAGRHDLAVRSARQCFEEVKRLIELKPGKSRKLEINPEPIEARVRVEAKTGAADSVEATAWAGDKKLGPVPGEYDVPVCTREIEVRAEGRDPVTESVSLDRNSTTAVAIKLRDETAPAPGPRKRASEPTEQQPVRYIAGGTMGLATQTSVSLETPSGTNDFDRRISGAGGFFAEADFPIASFFAIGVRGVYRQYRLGDSQSGAKILNADLVPKLTYDFSGASALYLGMPGGFSVVGGLNGPNFELDTAYTWNLGGVAGVNYMVARRFGMFLEGGVQHQRAPYEGRFTDTGTEISEYDASFTTATINVGLVF